MTVAVLALRHEDDLEFIPAGAPGRTAELVLFWRRAKRSRGSRRVPSSWMAESRFDSRNSVARAAVRRKVERQQQPRVGGHFRG